MAKAAASQPSRPFGPAAALVFAVLSAAGTWLMRIQTAVEGVPVGLDALVATGSFGDGTPLRRTYTGAGPVDLFLSYLVASFLAGTAGWDDGVRLQQIHLLVNLFAIVCIWNVEACRGRNAGRLISFTGVFAFFYQTVGGAVIIPLFYVAYVYSSSVDSYLKSGRQVPLGHARALLPAVVLGYLVPTVALYTPWGNIDITQRLTAFWQVAPLLPNVLLLVLAPLLSPSSSPSSSSISSATADVKHLKRIYLASGLVCTVTQLGTLYACLTSDNPQLSPRYVFLPSTATWKDSPALGLHYIFQWDAWVIYGSSLAWCWLVAVDTMRVLERRATVYEMLLAVFTLLFLSALAGPGTAMALVWNWREDRLVMIEQGVRGTVKKPKTA